MDDFPYYIEPEESSIESLKKFLNANKIDSANFDVSENLDKKMNDLQKLHQTQEILMECKSKKIIFSNPIIYHNELPVISPKTINVIQGKKGQHKSRLAEYICSALLKKDEYNKEILGFEVDKSRSYTVCLIDTERNITEQLPYAIQQIQLRAGYDIEENPEHFVYTSLLEIDRKNRFEALRSFIEYLKTKHQNHIFIVLDVLTDCIANFNDPKDSLNLIDLMNMTINEFDVTFLCVIHENPNSEKARGHLGTEIINKASTVLQVGFVKDSDQNDTDLVKVTYQHCRLNRRHDPYYIEYSDEENGLVLAHPDKIIETLDTRNYKVKLSDVKDFIQENLHEAMERQALINKISNELGYFPRLTESRLKEIIEQKQAFRIENKEFLLKKEKNGKITKYFLEYQDPEKDDFLF